MAEYRIDDLAQAAGTSVRNVRVYQDRGLLPAPSKQGRVAIYTEAHLARLRLVIQMLGRGYAFAQIKELIEAWEDGKDLGDLLGLEDAITQPWSDEVPAKISLVELRRQFGSAANPRNLKRAMDLGLIVRRGAHLVVVSPRLLQAARELLAAGVPMGRVIEMAEVLRRQTDSIAELFVQVIRRDLLDVHGPKWVPGRDDVPELTAVARRLRPLVQSAAGGSLALSMAEAFGELLDERARVLLEVSERGDDHGG